MPSLIGLWKNPDRRLMVALFLMVGILYIPFAGNYGLWDPWETHYSEVARQMLMRHDYVSLWWPGSPQDRNEFWSKPVLTFWLMVLGFLSTGLERADHKFDGEMAVGWTAEWSVRMPFILCSIACLWAVWELTRRLAGRRAAAWAVVVLATSSQFFYVARQAMTDMAFVAPIAVALCFAGLAFMLPPSEVEEELPRREKTLLGRWKLSWPHVGVYYATTALVLLVVVPQLVLIAAQVTLAIPIGKRVLRTSGIVPMLPWLAALVGYLILSMRARRRRQIYLHMAFLMGGVATLAKGPAGIGLPVIVVFLYLLVQGDIKRLAPPWVTWAQLRISGYVGGLARLLWRVVAWVFARSPLELGMGLLIFMAVAVPWYHAMLIRHGMGFWNEFIGDNYVHRAAGRHGDRGTFEYYLLQIGHGMFPWIGIVAAGVLASLRRLGRDAAAAVANPPPETVLTGEAHPYSRPVEVPTGAPPLPDEAEAKRTRLRGFAMVWFLTMFAVMSLVNTKFHHYILPGLPALAILAGLYLDELFTAPRKLDALALLLVGVPLLALASRDLAMFPARLTWLFDYDYVNAPNGGRAWPPGAEYDYSMRMAIWGVVATAATVIVGVVALLRAIGVARAAASAPAPTTTTSSSTAVVAAAGDEAAAATAEDGKSDIVGSSPPWALLVGAVLLVGTVVAAQLWQPAFKDGAHPLHNGWILVGAVAVIALSLILWNGIRSRSHALPVAFWVMGAVACVWTAWGLDRLLTDLSPHWSQKHVIASYYMNRKGPEEPLIAWNMYWRGETFYSKNQIYDHRIDQKDKTVFLGDHNAEKLQTYFKAHPGRRVFFIVERSRFEALRALLPEGSKQSLKFIDDSNNKVYLAVADI